MFSIIVAFDKNRLIGKNNIMPWHYKEDLEYFKKTTLGKTVVMGSKTFESILSYQNKPLPNRKNIVITSNREKYSQYSDIEFFDSISQFIQVYQNSKDEIFIIGGRSIYAQLMNDVDRLYITHIEKEFIGDTYFPDYNEKDFILIQEKSLGELRFCIYERTVKNNE